MQGFHKLADSMIHDSYKTNYLNREEYARQKFFLFSAFFTFGISILYIPLCDFIDYKIGEYVAIFIILMHFFIFYLSSININMRLRGNIFSCLTYIAITIVTVTSGGLTSAIIAWFLATEVIAFWYAGRKDGIFWAFIIVTTMIIIFITEMMGVQYPILYNQNYQYLFSAFSQIGVFLYYMTVIYVYEKVQKEAVKNEKFLTDCKQEVINVIAHDLRNPLMVLSMRLNKLSRINESDSDILREYNYLQSSVITMGEILDGILAMAKSGDEIVKSEEIFNIKNTILAPLEDSKSTLALKKGIEIDFLCRDDSLLVFGNKLSFIRIINNLISNAIKYSFKNSKVEIKLYNDENQNILEIHDDGIGFDKKQIELAFESFSNVGNKPTDGEDSHGLGLSIVKNLVEKGFNGSIELESLGRNLGSTFRIFLPIASQELNTPLID